MVDIIGVNFCYPHHQQHALQDVSVHFAQGSFTLVSGPTGCGKSTLLKCVSGIIPQRSKGQFSGSVRLAGVDAFELSPAQISRHVGMVFQCPDDQIFATTVGAEVAFGPENHGLGCHEVQARVEWALNEVGLGGFDQRQTQTLSGGQKQRVSIAAQLALQPEILVLDEPVSQLDPAGAADVMACLKKLHDAGRTIILVEHRLGEALQLASDVVIMDSGRIAYAGERDRSFASGLYEELGLQLPDPIRLHRQLGAGAGQAIAWSADEAAVALAEHLQRQSASVGAVSALLPVVPLPAAPPPGELVLQLKQVTFGYTKSAPPLFSDLSLTIRRGDRVAVMGANGGGKSTLLGLLAGLLKPWRGVTQRPSLQRSGFLFQNPDLMLFCPTLAEEMQFGRWHRELAPAQAEARIGQICRDLGVAAYLNRPTSSLSRGQRLRAALAVILAPEPDVLFLDEPTTGQDRENVCRMMEHLLELAHVETLVFCTHDLSVALDHANRLLLVNAGGIVADGPPHSIAHQHDALAECHLRLPFAHQVAHALDNPNFNWLTMEELCETIA